MSSRITHFFKLSSLLFVGLLALSDTLHVHAQEGLSVTVQPSTIDEQVNPGQVLEGVLTISNREGGKQTYLVSTRNVTGMSETGKPDFSLELSHDPLEAASWIQPSVETITMEEGDSLEVPYRISVPEDASPGGHYAAFFITREADEAIETGAGVGFHVVSLVNLRVSGEVNEDMLFREFSTSKAFFSEPAIVFNARLENTGTVHQRPQGLVAIEDMFGNSVGQVQFNESRGAILPHFERVFETTWTHEGFALGRYTAMASFLVGETSKTTLTREISFWILPLKEMGVVFGALLVLGLVFIVAVRSYVRRMLKKAGQGTLSKQKSEKVSFAQRILRTTIWLLTLLALLFIGMVVFFA